MKLKSTLFFLFLSLFGELASAQSSTANSNIENSPSPSVALLTKQYYTAFPVHPELFNGPEYVDYSKKYFKSEGHQFFESPDKQVGSIYYTDHLFENVQLIYDVVTNKLILQHPTTPLLLNLINERVEYFTIAKHHFIRLVADSAVDKVINTGYYEVLVDSKVQLLASRRKQMQEKIEGSRINVEFYATDKLFLKKGEIYYPSNKKSAVLDLLSDREGELKAYIKTNKLRFKKNRREADIVQLTQYYCSLTSR